VKSSNLKETTVTTAYFGKTGFEIRLKRRSTG